MRFLAILAIGGAEKFEQEVIAKLGCFILSKVKPMDQPSHVTGWQRMKPPSFSECRAQNPHTGPKWRIAAAFRFLPKLASKDQQMQVAPDVIVLLWVSTESHDEFSATRQAKHGPF